MEFSPDIHPSVPQLATKETASLRADYPCIEHLEAGNIAPWLVERVDQLLVRAKTERAGMNLAKCVTLATASVGAVCYATSPLAPIGAIVAGVGYLWSVVQDLNDTHQFAPIPFIRGNFLEFLSAMGDSEARAEWFAGSNEIVDLMNHLAPTERSEFVMLRQYTSTLTDFLTGVEAGKRFYAYRWLLDNFTTYRGAFPTVEQLAKHLAQVSPDPRIDHTQVTLIQQQSQLTQPKLSEPKFTELPQPKFIESPVTQEAIAPQTNGTNIREKSNFEVINHLASKIQNSFIVGLPGSGKDFLISHATRQIKKDKPTVYLFLIDCKNDKKEHGYYEHFDHIERIPNWDCSAWEYVTWFKKVWRKYEEVANQCECEGRKCLVVINEGTRTGQCFSEEKDPFIKGKLTAITSSGDSRGRNVWFMTQAPQLTDLGFGDNVRSQLLTIAILHKNNIGAITNWWKTGILGRQLKQEELLTLIKDSPRDRIVYSGQSIKWYPMPELKNYSGYDRDKEEFLSGYKNDSSKEVSDNKVADSHFAMATKERQLSGEEERLIQLLNNLNPGFDTLLDRFGVENNEEHQKILTNKIREVARIADRLDLLVKFDLK